MGKIRELNIVTNAGEALDRIQRRWPERSVDNIVSWALFTLDSQQQERQEDVLNGDEHGQKFQA